MPYDPSIRVIKAGQDHAWEVIPTAPDDPNPPGEEVVSFRSGDARFSFGLWKRVPETGPMEPPYHEIAVIIEGEVEIQEEDGTMHHAGPGTCSSRRRARGRPGRRSRPSRGSGPSTRSREGSGGPVAAYDPSPHDPRR